MRACVLQGWDFPTWHFNDSVFQSVNWSSEPSDSLYELYKKRALQIREQYKNVIISFSGGIDSTTVLRSFVDNNIKVDGIVIQGVNASSSFTGATEVNSEVTKVAIPYIKKLEKQKGIKFDIFLQDISNSYRVYKSDDWVDNLHNYGMLSPQPVTFNSINNHAWFKNKLEVGSTCLVKGLDKPRVYVKDGYWRLSFLDSILANGQTKQQSDQLDYTVEAFFWQSNLPDLLVKQAHEVIKYCESANVPANICSNPSKMVKYIEPIIYSRYVPASQTPGSDRKYYSVGKPDTPSLWIKDRWFLHSNEFETEKANWLNGCVQLASMLPDRFFNDGTSFTTPDQFNNFVNFLCTKYNIPLNVMPKTISDRHWVFGTVSSISTEYIIKAYGN